MRIISIDSNNDSKDAEEILGFFYPRLFYKSNLQIVNIYNREFDILTENSKLQFFIFLSLDRIMKSRFDFSPMILETNINQIKLTGKVTLTKDDRLVMSSNFIKKV